MANPEKLDNAVLDSSVIIKWFSEEEDTDIALSLREKNINGELMIAVPDLSLYEVANALRYNPTIDEDNVKEAIDSIIALGINIVVPTKEVMDLAISFALKYDITVYDAYFIALAKVLDFACITADEKLYQKVKELNFVRLLKNC
ncbi:type II toxin-antitoxin system VapC family toxin [Candidatus Woesearchaeota archaeon]|nr:type II toxin-antitoxin system VapC family toxin [Candidatus Woesearchaeota archaeon]